MCSSSAHDLQIYISPLHCPSLLWLLAQLRQTVAAVRCVEGIRAGSLPPKTPQYKALNLQMIQQLGGLFLIPDTSN